MISTESAVTLLAVAGVIGLGYAQFGPASNSQEPTPTAELTEQSSSKKTKKKKGKKSASPSSESGPLPSPPIPPVVAFPEVIPGGLDTDIRPVSEPAPQAPKPKKKKKAKQAQVADSATEDTAPAASSARSKKAKARNQDPSKSEDHLHGSMSIETDGSWTRVGAARRRRQAASASDGPSADVTSDTGITTSVTGADSPVTERTEEEEEDAPEVSRPTSNRRPLAERLLPKPRKTGVEDILETPDVPPPARVMRVQPRPGEHPASGFSWGDYEDVEVGNTTGGENDADGEDDGWGVVPSRKKPRSARTTTPSAASSLTASETATKRQRQNAKKREAEKAAKADAEKVRLATLAAHQRSLEKARLTEQLKKPSGSKVQSGGMAAAVDERGRLVWE